MNDPCQKGSRLTVDNDVDTDCNNNHVNEGSHSSSSYLLLDDDKSPSDVGSSPLLSQRSVVVEDIDNARSQVTFDTMDLTNADFLTPCGLSSFSVVAFPEKTEDVHFGTMTTTSWGGRRRC